MYNPILEEITTASCMVNMALDANNSLMSTMKIIAVNELSDIVHKPPVNPSSKNMPPPVWKQ